MTIIKLPDYVAPSTGIGRPSASQINKSASTTSERTLSGVGYGKPIPLLYGEDLFAGVVLAGPVTHPSRGWIVAIGWTLAAPFGAQGVQKLYEGTTEITHQGNGDAQRYIAHYDGTQTSVDPMLSSIFSGFADTFNGIAYSAIRIPHRSSGGEPKIQALVRGRKILDPRTPGVPAAYSTNPGLAFNDFVTNTQWGLGRPIRGIEAVADRCDSLVSGTVRCKLDYAFIKRNSEVEFLNELSIYAECLWYRDGATIVTVPDAPVEAPIATIPTNRVISGSLRPTTVDLFSSPTSVTANYIEPVASSTTWLEQPARVFLPGVEDGLIEDSPSDINLPGIKRRAEALRKANSRLKRLQNIGNIALQLSAIGFKYEKGDVVDFEEDHELYPLWIRILNKEMPAHDIYQLTAEVYDPTSYDDSGAGVVGTLPIGAIIPLITGAIPPGFDRFTAADGKWIKGGTSSGLTGGSDNWTVRATTTFNGEHTGVEVFGSPTPEGGPGGGVMAAVSSMLAAGTHYHEFDVVVNLGVDYVNAPLSQDIIWIKNTSSGEVPVNAGVLCAGTLLNNLMLPISWPGRIISSAATMREYGRAFPREFVSTTTVSGRHRHSLKRYSGKLGSSVYQENDIEAGEHVHQVRTSMNYTVKGMNLAFYQAMLTTEVSPGTIVGWESSSGPIPAGWRLCDGTNGSKNLVDRFIVSSDPSAAGSTTGASNALTLSGVTVYPAGAHHHRTNLVGYEIGQPVLHSEATGDHNHSVQSVTNLNVAELPYYTLMFIEYTGV